jgi:hypothetical protein
MKDFSWYKRTSAEKERIYFAGNASINLHSWRHATRCFKKGSECFACLPEVPNEKGKLSYAEDVDLWSDYFGINQPRSMFRFYPSRGTEDAFVNTHNHFLTKLNHWNTNVLTSITGRAVFYVTCYNIKAQQNLVVGSGFLFRLAETWDWLTNRSRVLGTFSSSSSCCCC